MEEDAIISLCKMVEKQGKELWSVEKIWTATCTKTRRRLAKPKSLLGLIHIPAILASLRHHFSQGVLEHNPSSFKTDQPFTESYLSHEMSPHLTIKSIMLRKPMARAWHYETL